MEGCAAKPRPKACSLLCFPVDLSRREQIDTPGRRRCASNWADVDILVNNAGIVSGKSFLECSDGEIERSLAVNLFAHIWTIRAFLPGMIERGSRAPGDHRLGRGHHRRCRG